MSTIKPMSEQLERVRDYFADRADASMEPGEDRFHGNEEMALLADVDAIATAISDEQREHALMLEMDNTAMDKMQKMIRGQMATIVEACDQRDEARSDAEQMRDLGRELLLAALEHNKAIHATAEAFDGTRETWAARKDTLQAQGVAADARLHKAMVAMLTALAKNPNPAGPTSDAAPPGATENNEGASPLSLAPSGSVGLGPVTVVLTEGTVGPRVGSHPAPATSMDRNSRSPLFEDWLETPDGKEKLEYLVEGVSLGSARYCLRAAFLAGVAFCRDFNAVHSQELDSVPEGCTPTDARVLREANGTLADENNNLRLALRFYANGWHYDLEDWEPPDEPNWLCPPSEVEIEELIPPGSWTPDAPPPKKHTGHFSPPWMVEDGSIAAQALRGKAINWDEDGDEGNRPPPIVGEPEHQSSQDPSRICALKSGCPFPSVCAAEGGCSPQFAREGQS